jgi:DNA-binding HxlR family transcriptional regulator
LAVTSHRPGRIQVTLNFSAYPVQESLGVLGRKWALLILMNIALGQAQRFNEMLRKTPRMSKRILAMRLHELERNGFITRAEQRRGFIRWQLTAKGADVLPVLLTLIHFASKWRVPSGSPEGSPPSWGQTFEIAYHGGVASRIVQPKNPQGKPAVDTSGGARTTPAPRERRVGAHGATRG